MTKVNVLNLKGEKVKDIVLKESVWNAEVNEIVMHDAIIVAQSSLRQGTASTKTRSEVSGGGRKPYKQKGTGNARAGSSRSPLWVGGGVTFGPTSERNFKERINSKMKKRAILAIFGKAIKSEALSVITDLEIKEPKTKIAKDILNNLKAEGSITIVCSLEEKNTVCSFRNIAGINVMAPNLLRMPKFISSDRILVTEKALAEIEENFKTN